MKFFALLAAREVTPITGVVCGLDWLLFGDQPL